MIKEAIEKILSLAPSDVRSFHDSDYSTNTFKRIQAPSEPLIHTHTLESVVNYIKDQHQEDFMAQKPFIHVADHETVSVLHSVKSHQRNEVLRASISGVFDYFEFDRTHDKEKFIIELMSKFQKTPDLKKIQTVSAKTKGGTIHESSDDGITQTVSVSAGIALQSNEKIENPVVLAPYRTFREIDQPESRFVFRLKDRGDSMPHFGLYESDGGSWKLEAIKLIKEYLSKQLPEVVIIG